MPGPRASREIPRKVARRLLRRRVTGTAYWERRAKDLGERAVFNSGHGDAELDSVTEKQKDALYPLFRDALDGSEHIVLDFGCGTGRFTHDLAEMISGRAIGVDPIERLIRLAPASDSVAFKRMEPGRIPLADATVDAAWVCLVLGGITDSAALTQAARELERTLRPNGLLFLAENTAPRPDAQHWAFRSEDVYRELFPAWRLDRLGEYSDLGERISVLAGRRG